MTDRLDRWIQAIADDPKTTFNDVVVHILKHVFMEISELQNGSPTEQLEWLASMDNLLDIAKTMLKVEPSVELRLQRLQAQVDKYPETRTPEPQ